MEKTRKLMEAISGMSFYREFSLDELCFAPAEDSHPESADLILTLGDVGILFNYLTAEDFRLAPGETDSQRLTNLCNVSRQRIVNTVRMIADNSLDAYCSPDGRQLKLPGNPVMFALIVLDDSIRNCPRILRKQKPTDIIVNCASDSGFREICKALISPMELMHYLYYRERFYARREEENLSSSTGEPVLKLFLSDRYGYRDSNSKRFHLEEYRTFLQELPDHIQNGPNACSLRDVNLFLTHLTREEAAAFIERMQVLIVESRRGASGMLSSLRPRDDRYAVFFVGRDTFPMKVIRNMFCGKSNVQKVMEIITHHDHDEEYQVEFLMEDVA